MNDCVFSTVCEGRCRCDAYLSSNTEEDYALHEEYWEKVRKVTKPVREWLESQKIKRLEG